MILVFDPATHCGWACGLAGAEPADMQWGARDFSAKSNGEVLATFRAWVSNLCFVYKPTVCVYETPYIPQPRQAFTRRGLASKSPPPMNPLVLRRLLGMTGNIDAVCFELRIRCFESTSQEFTKYVTGKGRYPGGRDEKKQKVIEGVGRYGFDVQGDDNAADALALWLWTEAIVAPNAAEHRARMAADRQRQIQGIGGLFGPEEVNASRVESRGVLETTSTPGKGIEAWRSNRI